MERKPMRSVIEKVSLSGDVLKGESFEPTLINFFFGKNGSGKSTIAKQIGETELTQFKDGINLGDYEILRYNEEFINQNVRSYGNLPGVFTITEEDANDKERLEKANDEYAKAKKEQDRLTEEAGKIHAQLNQAETIAVDKVWKATAGIRDDYPLALGGVRNSKKKFFDKICGDIPAVDTEESKIKELYEAAFNGKAKRYDFYLSPQAGQIPTSALLDKQIVSSGSTPFAEFVKALNNIAWVEQGHKNYHGTAGQPCPYCHKTLPDTFEEDLASCYDAAYQSDLKSLQAFRNSYRDALNNVYKTYEKNFGIGYECEQATRYKDKVDLFMAIGKNNLQLIDKKIEDPSQPIELESFDDVFVEIENLRAEINELISKNNELVGDADAAKDTCSAVVLEKIEFICQTVLIEFFGKKKSLEKQEREKRDEAKQYDELVTQLKKLINELNSKTTNTVVVMDSINKMLKMGAFQGFQLQEKPNAKYVYQLVRGDGKIAEGLSEGERHIISFLYFYYLIIGSQNDNGERKNKIVIIDDPVSSMDSTSMALVAQLVRNIVSICYNNYDLDSAEDAEDYVKQFFCLTHNPYFFKEITYNRIADYECVSLYELKKGNENRSKVIQCTQEKKVTGGGWENYSPVKNYYDGLWYEYKTTKESIALANAMRGILEYYFMQMCGYPTESLRAALLKVEQTGEVDKNDYDLAYSLLSTLDSGRGRLDVGIDFDSSGLNLEQARKVFKLIFELMHQDQHYKLMMGEK